MKPTHQKKQHRQSIMKNSLPTDIKIKRDGYYWRPFKEAKIVKLGSTKSEALINCLGIKSGKTDVELLSLRNKEETAKSIMFASMKCRARNKKLNLMSKEDFVRLWDRAHGKCEATGIKFEYEQSEGNVKRPWSPSVDRIDSSGHYIYSNCRIVCTSVNLALNEWGDEVLNKIAIHLSKKLRLVGYRYKKVKK